MLEYHYVFTVCTIQYNNSLKNEAADSLLSNTYFTTNNSLFSILFKPFFGMTLFIHGWRTKKGDTDRHLLILDHCQKPSLLMTFKIDNLVICVRIKKKASKSMFMNIDEQVI